MATDNSNATNQSVPMEVFGQIVQQFTDAINRMSSAAVSPPATPSIATPANTTTTIPVVEKALNWTNFPRFPGKCNRVDAWFLSLENKLKAARIPEHMWASKLMECPTIGEELKRALLSSDEGTCTDYAKMREYCLDTYGPAYAVGYFTTELLKVKGTNREDVVEKLEDIRALHNRAAELIGSQLWTDRDLVYPFVEAFPEEVANNLRREIRPAMRGPHPLQDIVDRAPSKEEPGSDIPLVAAANPTTTLPTDKEEIIAAVRNEVRSGLDKAKKALAKTTNPGRRCAGCGRSCPSRDRCPAQGKTCRNCGILHHFAVVCRKPKLPRGAASSSGQNRQVDRFSNPNYNSAERSYIPVAGNARICCVGTSADIPVRVNDRLYAGLVDSGAAVSLINKEWTYPQELERSPVRSLGAANGEPLSVVGHMTANLQVGESRSTLKLYVSPTSQPRLILGRDFMAATGLVPFIREGYVKLPDGSRLSFLPTAPTLVAVATVPVKITMNEQLGERERHELQQVIAGGAFASDSAPFGKVRGFTHAIDTGNHPPVHLPLRRTSPQERDVVRQEVEKMLAHEVIRPSTSAWAAPIVLVRKKDNSTRFCVDYRRLNDITTKDVFPLPRIDDMLAALHGAQYFSSLDAASGYWQVAMDPAAVEKTAFICTEGLFEFLVMPFGLCNAPSTFQRMMQQVLGGLLWTSCLVYLDDILVFGKSFQEHNQNLSQVLRRLKGHGLLLKASKCHFGHTSTVFLGFVVSSQGVRPEPSKVEKIQSYPRPTNTTQVRAFIGLGSYYRRFIPKFAQLATPLHQLTTNDEWSWNAAHEEAFSAIKAAIAANAVQAHPDFTRPFIIDTDASDVGVGIILSQKDGQGRELIVAVDSRKFSRAELKWHIREKEALGIIWALEKFRPFILGRPFTVRTDHSSLRWLLDAKSGRLQRWALKLAEFGSFTIIHRAGQTHTNVDAFTRVFANSDCVDDHMVVGAVSQLLPIWPGEHEWAAAQDTDERCQKLLQSGNAQVRNGLIGIYRNRKGWRPVLPGSLIESVTKRYHEHPLGGHLGARKLLSVLAKKCVLLGATRQVKSIISTCQPCLQRKRVQLKLGLMASKPPRAPWDTVAMDFCGPYNESNQGCRYVLVFVDQFTKWVELVPTRDQVAMTVVTKFYERVICRHGCPVRLLSDNGPQFRSALVQTLCDHFGIAKVYASAYYPQGDGYAERMMRTLNNSLAVLSRGEPGNWPLFVPGLNFAYNSTEHEATHISPFELNTGRIPRLPGEPESGGSTSANQYLRKLRSLITNHRANAVRCTQKYWEAMKRRFDAGRNDLQLARGTRVLVKLTDLEIAKYPCRKLSPRWSGPGTVVGILGNLVTYEVDFGGQDVRKIHISRLLPLPADVWGSGFGHYRDEAVETPGRAVEAPKRAIIIDETEDGDVHFEKRPRMGPAPQADPLPIPETPAPVVQPATTEANVTSPLATRVRKVAMEAETQPGSPPQRPVVQPVRYDVQRIHQTRFVDRRKEFLVEWAGYPDPKDFTWQPRKELEEDVPRIVRQFERIERQQRIEAEQAEARALAEEQASLRRIRQERRRRRFARED